ncbi:MAG: hypothetical protein WBA17_00015 [Saprospiraceae bacterium]
MNRIGRILLGCCLLLVTWSIARAETRYIHVLRIMDDLNQQYTIREGCRSVSYGLDREVEMVRNQLGITEVIQYDISGTNFSRERLDDILEYDMAYQERDIIFVVYVGHGFRPPGDRGMFPNLYFQSYEQSLSFDDVRTRLLDLNPSLLLNIVVACNVEQLDPLAPPPYLEDNRPPPVAVLPPGRPRRVEPYLQLFADQESYTKVIDLVSAQPGQYTYLTTDGGIFFSEVMHAFHEVFTDKIYQNWTDVCSNITQNTVQRSQLAGTTQLPICQYTLWLNPVTVSLPAVPMSRSQCKQLAREVRSTQRSELRNLRRSHRAQACTQEYRGREVRRLLRDRQRVELAQLRFRHETDYQRRLQQCN